MNVLGHLRLRTKLILLLGLFGLGLVASTAFNASTIYRRMLDDRIDKLKAAVDMAQSRATALERQVTAGQMTRDQQMALLRDDLHTMRFDAGDGYLVLLDPDGISLIYGTDPARDNKPSVGKDASGRSVTDLMRVALRNADTGTIFYATAKPGQSRPQPKVAYISRFHPLNAVFLAGAYTDDLDRDIRAQLVTLVWMGGAILLLTLLAAWFISQDITRSLTGLRTAMTALATGDAAIEVPGVARRDEVGAMAQAVLVFKEHMRTAQRLATERDADRARAENDKRAALVDMAETIEREAASAMHQIDLHADAMAKTAEDMNASANRTGAASGEAATSAAHALANAQTVASAAEQLAASIREISGQVNQSNAVVGRAVAAGNQTRAAIEALNDKVGRIGAVADMIGDIAAKTNLLALNATIEAARAGDAGKGFAVVASEVKQLATQTAKSTEEITRHIAEVRTATAESVTQVAHIETTITEINAIAGSIAVAVEQQQTATAEIARNVGETANAANEMTQRTEQLAEEARRTGTHANAVMQSIEGLKAAALEMTGSVTRIVRSSTPEVNRRRSERYKLDGRGRITLPGFGTHEIRVVDISEGGAGVRGGPALTPHAAGTLQVDGVNHALAFAVREVDAHGTAHLVFTQPGNAALQSFVERLAPRRAA